MLCGGGENVLIPDDVVVFGELVTGVLRPGRPLLEQATEPALVKGLLLTKAAVTGLEAGGALVCSTVGAVTTRLCDVVFSLVNCGLLSPNGAFRIRPGLPSLVVLDRLRSLVVFALRRSF